MNYGQPYFNTMNQYSYQPMYQPIQQPIQQPKIQQQAYLQGKSVDNIEVVKAMDIPLDGSISYFPLTDGTSIVTKQLQQDGTSKTVIYKPIETEKPEDNKKYITTDELDERIKKIDNSSIKDDIKTMKRQIKDLIEDIKDINKDIRNREE